MTECTVYEILRRCAPQDDIRVESVRFRRMTDREGVGDGHCPSPTEYLVCHTWHKGGECVIPLIQGGG